MRVPSRGGARIVRREALPRAYPASSGNSSEGGPRGKGTRRVAPRDQPICSARMGSTRAARRDGSQEASAATAQSSAPIDR